MQVSFVCSEHSLKSRGPEERLSRPPAGSPSPGTHGRFRAVAMVARSLGQLSVQSVPSAGDSSVKQPGMKYRYEGRVALQAGGSPPCLPLHEPYNQQNSRGQSWAVCAEARRAASALVDLVRGEAEVQPHGASSRLQRWPAATPLLPPAFVSFLEVTSDSRAACFCQGPQALAAAPCTLLRFPGPLQPAAMASLSLRKGLPPGEPSGEGLTPPWLEPGSAGFL